MNDFQEKRIAAGLSQAKLAELVGCNQSTICRLENGKEINKSTEFLIRSTLDRLCSVNRDAMQTPMHNDALEIREPLTTYQAPEGHAAVVCDTPATLQQAGSPADLADASTVAVLRRRVAELESQLRDKDLTIANLSDALAAGLGRSRALKSPLLNAKPVTSGGASKSA